jgi:hypothetical protein
MPYKDKNDPRLKEARRKHYYANKQQYLDRNATYKRRNKEFLIEYLQNNPCVDCGESDIRCLQFDHRDRELKSFDIGRAVADGLGIETIVAEIEKCDVRCANCHSKVTAAQFGWLKNSYVTANG